MYSATSLAYFKSMASPLMPMAKVRIGVLLRRAAMAHTKEESSPPGQQEAHLGVGHQPLFHPGDQLFPDVPAYRFQVIPADPLHLGHIR